MPEFNHTIDFSLPLIWSDHRSQSVSLAEMLEHGELKIDIYHKMNSDSNEKQPSDIHLCYCKIPLKELIIRHTGNPIRNYINKTFFLFDRYQRLVSIS